MSLRGAKRRSNLVILFLLTTCYFLLTICGCGKNPVFNYLPEQKSTDTGGGSEITVTQTLNIVVVDDSNRTKTDNSTTIQSGNTLKISYTVKGLSDDKGFGIIIGTYPDYMWVITDIPNSTKSVIYGTLPSGAKVVTYSAKTLTKGNYKVTVIRLGGIIESGGRIYTSGYYGEGTLIVE
jgi:hypothetical protein